MVAHSQAFLLLSLVLEDPVNKGDRLRRGQMRKHFRIYTFGNPSIHWKVRNGATSLGLNSYFRITGHFANETGFVAGLGVLRPCGGANDRYSNLFVNENWKG